MLKLKVGLLVFLACVFALGLCEPEELGNSPPQPEEAPLEEGEDEDEDAIPENAQNVMKFSPPSFSEEEGHSIHMPSHLRCDACLAIAYVMTQEFQALQQRFKSRPRPSEPDIMDAVEEACMSPRFENYGVKTKDGKNMVSGPGLPGESIPGMMEGGGRWTGRFRKQCIEYTGEVDEYDLYDAFLTSGGVKGLLCAQEPACTKLASGDKDEL